MDKLRVDGPTARVTLMGDEIGELRKYIVEMMHAEMELMENIKLNERNIAAANAHIKHFKELNAQERARYKTLKNELAGDTNELKKLEKNQIVVEEKHQAFRDAVSQRESEVQALCSKFQQQQNTMLSLRSHVLHASSLLEKLSSLNDSVENEMQKVSATVNECTEPTEQHAARQKLRAKIRYTQQFIAQMQDETKELIDEGAKLKAEVLGCELEAHKLRDSIVVKEKENEILFHRLREDTLRIIKENGKIENKLKGKRKRFRHKTKNEITSLNRRTAFITSELERGQMMNEDTLSAIDFFYAKREELEQSLQARNEKLAAVESSVAELSKTISSFRRGEKLFDTTSPQEELAVKRDAAQAAQKKLDEKHKLLDLLEADHVQLNTALEDIGAKIVAAKDTTEKLDREIASLAKDFKEQEERSQSVRVSVGDLRTRNETLNAELEEGERKNKIFVKAKTKLCRQINCFLKQEEELSLAQREAEALSQLLGEGIKHGMKSAEQAREANARNADTKTRIEFELRRQELNLQQQSAQEESQFEAEVATWDEKIKSVERQLQGFT